METNTEPVDPLSANVAALATESEAAGTVAMEAGSDGEDDTENADKVTETVMNGSMKETLSLTVDAKTETAVFKRASFATEHSHSAIDADPLIGISPEDLVMPIQLVNITPNLPLMMIRLVIINPNHPLTLIGRTLAILVLHITFLASLITKTLRRDLPGISILLLHRWFPGININFSISMAPSRFHHQRFG
ncbi:UNVERIFIED_CONTAM: hypothetical protein K2H54_064100 [Gekko kuhli]